MRRTHVHLTEQQAERLAGQSKRTGLPVAEIIRRAVDQYEPYPDAAEARAMQRMIREGGPTPEWKQAHEAGTVEVRIDAKHADPDRVALSVMRELAKGGKRDA